MLWPMAKRTAKPRAQREVEMKPEERPRGLPAPPPPRRLGEIIGQERAVGALQAGLRSGRVHHAWIFYGPAGVGKFTTALAVAAIVLDPTAQANLAGDIEPDPESMVQRLLATGTHSDLHIVSKELAVVSREPSVRTSKQRNIAKDVLEEFLIEPAMRTAAGGDRAALASKVFIIDEAELLAVHGQNALLKTLEEPAPGNVIILVTSSEERLLPTIRSRCQRVAFTSLSDDDMARWLRASGMDVGTLDATSRRWLMAYSAGSPGLAHLAVTTGLVEWHRVLSPMLAEVDRGRFPVDLGPTMAKLTEEWAVSWVERNQNASKEAANRAAARQMFKLVAEHYRQRLLSGSVAPETGAMAIELVREAEGQAESNVSGALLMENLAAQLAGMRAA
jgi:DNA polymerase III subunit delta'